jgi:glycosyltransferase involved in cell wall biosynthesis
MLRQRGQRFQLVVVGDGPLRPTLTRLAERLALADGVTFTGHVRDVYAALARFDVVVLPSEIEGLPYVILEAMSLGKVIVASAVGGMPEALSGGAAGLLVLPKAVPALAEAVGRLLADPSLRSQLGRAARARYQEAYTLDHMLEEHIQLYRRWHKRDLIQA